MAATQKLERATPPRQSSVCYMRHRVPSRAFAPAEGGADGVVRGQEKDLIDVSRVIDNIV